MVDYVEIQKAFIDVKLVFFMVLIEKNHTISLPFLNIGNRFLVPFWEVYKTFLSFGVKA